jgi:hypothetical protein
MLLLILAAPFVFATLIAGYGFRLRRSLPRSERPSGGWIAALVLILGADALLVLAFLLAIAVYNCHGAYDCPF